MHDVSLAIDFLHTVPPFNDLGKDDLTAVAGKLEAAYYRQGKTIFESAPPAGVAIIRKGAVRLLDESRKFLDKRSEGELFGHRIFFHGEQRTYVAEAEEDCLVWHLDQHPLEDPGQQRGQIAAPGHPAARPAQARTGSDRRPGQHP